MTEKLQVWSAHIKNYIKDSLEYCNIEPSKSEVALYLIIILPIIDAFWKACLKLRQYSTCKNAEAVPAELIYTLSRTTLHRMGEDVMTKLLFLFIYDLYDTLITTIIIFNQVQVYLWNYIIKETGWNSQVAVNFTWLLLFIILHIVLFLPLTMFQVFVLNDDNAFIVDSANKLVFLPVITIFMIIITYLEEWCIVVIWLILAVSYLIVEPIRNIFITYKFDPLVPLEEGQLRTEINTLANQFGFPLEQIYVTTGPCPPGHDSYVYRGQLVLHEHLCCPEKYQIDEVIALLTHEFGHWMSGHFMTTVIFEQIILLLIVPLFQFCFFHPVLYTALGFDNAMVIGLGDAKLTVSKPITPGYEEATPIVVGLLVVHYAMLPYYSILQFFLNYVSRKMEFHADGYCVVLNRSRSLKRALIKKYKHSVHFPAFDRLYLMWNFPRPSILERIENLELTE